MNISLPWLLLSTINFTLLVLVVVLVVLVLKWLLARSRARQAGGGANDATALAVRQGHATAKDDGAPNSNGVAPPDRPDN